MELKLVNIKFRYDKKYIFNNFNLSIKNGINFIIGNNNSGKSTLFKIVNGSLPYDGSIYIDNVDFRRYDDKFCLDFSYIDSIKGKVSSYLKDVDKRDLFDINDYLDCDIKELSYEIKVKISLIKNINDNNVVIIDNMLCWLSKNERNKFLKKIKSIAKKKIIIIITNNMEDLMFADRIILLDNGSVVIDEDKVSFFADKKRLEKYKVDLPFLIDLSYNLELYNIIDDVYYDIGGLVDAIWK